MFRLDNRDWVTNLFRSSSLFSCEGLNHMLIRHYQDPFLAPKVKNYIFAWHALSVVMIIVWFLLHAFCLSNFLKTTCSRHTLIALGRAYNISYIGSSSSVNLESRGSRNLLTADA